MFTYLIFDTIPFCVHSLGQIHRLRDYAVALAVIRILLNLNYTSDAIIYIFLQKDVRKELFKCISRRKHNVNNDKVIVKRRGDFPLQERRRSAMDIITLNSHV